MLCTGAKDLDFDAYHSRYVALELLYLGGNYQGFATQLDTEETIEVGWPAFLNSEFLELCLHMAWYFKMQVALTCWLSCPKMHA